MMELVRFLIGSTNFPVYRTITKNESEMLRALLGAGFHFQLEEGEPMDSFLFDVLSAVAMRAEVYFAPPPHSLLLGTFELHDAAVSLHPEQADEELTGEASSLTH
jgi:hypothetical protein